MTSRRKRPAEPSPGSRFALGRHGEDLAAAYLTTRGYRCVARRLRTRHAEIDLLLRRCRLVVAVEVKTSRDHPAPECYVDEAFHARLCRALVLLAPHLSPPPRRLRVDVVAVRIPHDAPEEIRHFPGTVFLAPRRGFR